MRAEDLPRASRLPCAQQLIKRANFGKNIQLRMLVYGAVVVVVVVVVVVYSTVHAASWHGTPRLTSLPKDGGVSCFLVVHLEGRPSSF